MSEGRESRLPDSNRRPTVYKTVALPTELGRRRTHSTRPEPACFFFQLTASDPGIGPAAGPFGRGYEVSVMSLVLVLLGLYLAIGFGFALVFTVFMVPRIDEASARGSLAFRVVIVPGAAALWPLLLVRAIAGRTRGA